MGRGAGARKRRSARRSQARVVRSGVSEARTQDSLAAVIDRPVPETARTARVALAPLAWKKVADAKAVLQDEGMAACADCDHAFDMHDGDGCMADECGCDGYVEPDEKPDEDLATARFELRVPEASVNEAAQVMLRGLQVVDASDPQDGTTTLGFAEATGKTMEVVKEKIAEQLSGLETTPVPVDVLPPARVDVPPPAPMPVDNEFNWSAIFAPEAMLTSDRRAFAPGSITWPRLNDGPLSLMAMDVTSEGGHVGAKLAGRIDRIWRDESVNLIRGSGKFNNDEWGQRIAELVDNRSLRGVSVDLAVSRYETGPRSWWFDEDGNWNPKPESERQGDKTLEERLIDLIADDDTDPYITVIYEAEIGMSTVCPFQAFGIAQIAIGDTLVAALGPDVCRITQDGAWAVSGSPLSRAERDAEPLVASAEDIPLPPLTASAAGLAPEKPPVEWFQEYDGPVGSVFVSEEGRVSGYVAVWDTCHLGYPGQCVEPPHSESGYAYFHLHPVECANGEIVECGQITMDTGHADHSLGREASVAHYDNTGLVVADVVAGENEHGIWVAGALRPGVDADKARTFKRAKLSGDWRGVNGKRELVAVLCVNVPGFPIPRPRALVAAGANGEELLALTAAGIPFIPESDLTPDQLEQFAVLKAHAEFAELAGQAG